MSSAMAHVYANLIKHNRKTLNQVPDNLKEQVKKILDEEKEESPAT